MDALAAAGTLSLTSVVIVWALWLAGQSGFSRAWKLLSLAVLPCVATPLVLSGVLADSVLTDVANGTLFVFAVLVSIGTLMRAHVERSR